MWKKGSILSIILKKGSILWVIFKKKVQFIETYWKKVQFFESSWKRMETILYFRKKKSATLWDFSVDTRFNSLSHPSRKSSILRVIFEKIRAQFFESNSRNPVHFFESIKKKSILCVILKKDFNSVSHIEKFKKKEVQFYESCIKSSILWVSFFLTQGSILWVILLEHWGSIFWVIFQKSGSIFFWVNQKKIILWVMLKRRVQYCESCWKQGFTSVSEKKGSILWVFFVSKKINSVRHVSKGLNSLSHFWRWGFFFFLWENSIFDSYKKRLNSLSHMVEKKFNSLSPMQKKEQLFQSNSKVFNTLSHFSWKNILCVVLIKKEFNSSHVKK